jgi:hypothetical protein
MKHAQRINFNLRIMHRKTKWKGMKEGIHMKTVSNGKETLILFEGKRKSWIETNDDTRKEGTYASKKFNLIINKCDNR